MVAKSTWNFKESNNQESDAIFREQNKLHKLLDKQLNLTLQKITIFYIIKD